MTAATGARAEAVFLVLLFASLGVLAGVELTRLARLSTSLQDAATALDQIGQASARSRSYSGWRSPRCR